MTELLTHQEYRVIANDMVITNTAFIDGKFKPGRGALLPTINPATGKKITDIASCNAADVNEAVIKAREAYNKGIWANMALEERKNILIKLCKLLTRNRHELAVLESIDSGKPIRDCALIDVPETIETIKWYAEAIDKIFDKTSPTSDDSIAMIIKESLGVVGVILPWNFPLLMLAWKIAPALALGNSVIVKPAEQTSLSTLKLAQYAYEAGIPSGVLQVLPGDGAVVGQAMGLHADIDMISFTGSSETGRLFLQYSAQSNMKKIVLECGGKNPIIVMDDAENLDNVAHHIVQAAFWNMGQNCSAGSRLLVHGTIKDVLIEKIQTCLRMWKTGDPLDPSNHLGSLIDAEHCTKVTSYLRDDANYIVQGNITNNFVEPFIIEVVDANDILMHDEIFGPILSVITVESLEQALHIANNTAYGLTASIFTANIKKALRLAKNIKAGTVTVNCYGEGDITTPFGGYKLSGFGGRDNGLEAFDQYSETKTIWIDLSDDALDKELD